MLHPLKTYEKTYNQKTNTNRKCEKQKQAVAIKKIK